MHGTYTWNARSVCVLCTVMHNTCTDLPYYAYEKFNINSVDMTLKKTKHFYRRTCMQCNLTPYLAQLQTKHEPSHVVVLWFVTYYHRSGNFHIKNNSRENFHGVKFSQFNSPHEMFLTVDNYNMDECLESSQCLTLELRMSHICDVRGRALSAAVAYSRQSS